MKRLWKTIPPCFSDVQGFQAVLDNTGGMGLVDDPSRYKPLRRDGAMGGRPHGGRGGEFHRGDRDRLQGGPGGAESGRRLPPVPGVRVMNSDIRNADIIRGTHQKVLDAFDLGAEHFSPDFVLLAYAPSSSMIGSDLDAGAEEIGARSGLPAACVDLHGDKDYLYGISRTLETMGRLLLTRRETLPNTVNLLGCNTLDWTQETLADVQRLLSDAGYTVLSRWGWKETTENLKQASAAQVNLVVHAAGLRLARYMEAEFGVPYVVGAPFGADQWTDLLAQLRGEAAGETPPDRGEPQALVIGEQLTADAIRRALLRRGFEGVQVLSFYDMDKAILAPGDQKLSSEDDLVAKAAQPSLKLVLGNLDYRAAAGRDLPWIGLPDGGSMSPAYPTPNFNMAGEELDRWLDRVLAEQE
jgi:hypothetical protein